MRQSAVKHYQEFLNAEEQILDEYPGEPPDSSRRAGHHFHIQGLLFLRVVALLVSQDHEPLSIGEQLRLLGDLYDIRVFRDRPEGLGIGTVVPVHRHMVAQISPFAMRLAVLLVVLRTDNV